MEKTFKILPATKNDVPMIFQFIKQLAAHGDLGADLSATIEILEDSLFGNKIHAEVIIGHLNDRPISYALFTHNFSTLLARPGLLLVDLFVLPEGRNKGIGRKMMGHLAKLAVERKCGRFEWSVHSSNKKSIMFYQHIGATVMDEWRTCRMTENAVGRLAAEYACK